MAEKGRKKRRTMIHRKLEVVCEQKEEQWSTEN